MILLAQAAPPLHSGEEWFQLQWPQYAILGAILITYLLLAYTNRLPSMQSFKDFADVINSAGGNIILLSLFTAWSIKIAMQFFYHILALSSETISKQDAIVTAGIAFVTGTLVGTFAGALIKTMTGAKANGGGPTKPDTLTASFEAADRAANVAASIVAGKTLPAQPPTEEVK